MPRNWDLPFGHWINHDCFGSTLEAPCKPKNHKELGIKVKKSRIAFTGVFDIANFGDHLFPLVFENEMEKRNLDFQIFLFSPFSGKEDFDIGRDVFSLSDMEKMHLQDPFDAIIVAGGEVVHFLQSDEKLQIGDTAFQPYPISQVWIIASLVALKYNIPLLWNAPGANSFLFKDPYRWAAKGLCSCVDYLCVRNETSKKILADCGIDEAGIKVCPDTALLISDIVPLTRLETVIQTLLPFSHKYVVFHTNRFLTEDGIQSVINTLDFLSELGYKIVLLPLAYSHGDDDILREINERAGKKYFEFSKALSLDEILSVLALCSLYIGASFHGCISSLAYGKKVLVFDIFQNRKTEDLLNSFGLEDCFISQPSQLFQAVINALENELNPDLGFAKSKIYDHFDLMFKMITSKYSPKKQTSAFIHGFLKSLSAFREQLLAPEEQAKVYISSLEKQISEKNAFIIQQEMRLQEVPAYLTSLEKQIAEKDAFIIQQETLLHEMPIYLASLENQIAEKDKYILLLENQVEEKNAQISCLENRP